MRDSFIRSLTQLLDTRDDVMVLSADLGFGIFDDIRARHSNRFINVGVAEQNMIGVATGLGLDGWTVFAYSIGNFPTLRCLEQIRNDAAYHEVNVTIVASGGGFTYGALGMSHHATEDLSIMRALPGVAVVAPCDAYESGQATLQLADRPGVGYLRIEKNVPFDTTDMATPFEIGKARTLRAGQDIVLFASGGIVAEALASADTLAADGVSVRVVSVHTLSPLDAELIAAGVGATRAVMTIEENTVSGGLGGAVAEVMADHGLARPFRRIGMQNAYSAVVGDQDYLRDYYALNAAAIVPQARALLERAGQL